MENTEFLPLTIGGNNIIDRIEGVPKELDIPACTVFRIDNRDLRNISFMKLGWQNEKTRDSQTSEKNNKFWKDVWNWTNRGQKKWTEYTVN